MKCPNLGCFRNKVGECKLLTEPTRTKPCPFFKTNYEAFMGYSGAAARLEEIGRPDLLEQAVEWMTHKDYEGMEERTE